MACAALAAGLISSGFAVVVLPDVYDHGEVHPDRAPMLDRVGQLGDEHCGSAVYLGKGWILTAYHAFLGCGSEVVIFSGERYKLRTGSAVRLTNENRQGAARFTDLVMVRLETSPDMEVLKINEQVPFIEELVVMVGCGETASAKAEGMILTGAADGAVAGGDRGRASSPHWGENLVSDRGLVIGVEDQPWQTKAFATVRQPHWTPHNAQGAPGDSGGGVFVKRGDRWELSGIMLSVLHREEMNASATFIADLSAYRKQIETTIPEPAAAGLLMVAGLLGIGRRRR